MKIEIKKYQLHFRFEAGTSRGVMTTRNSWFIKLYDPDNPNVFGIGECGPLPGLSPDLKGNLEETINVCKLEISSYNQLAFEQLDQIVPSDFPALKFAFEAAIIDLQNGGNRIIFQNDFVRSNKEIPINGLVWMGDKNSMLHRINDKIHEGYRCIKIKVGAINLEDELELLQYIRSKFSTSDITIRLDANGAFTPDEALSILDRLSRFDIHSIEQPIDAGNWKVMERLCKESPIPIALDEELIGINETSQKIALLESIKPSFIFSLFYRYTRGYKTDVDGDQGLDYDQVEKDTDFKAQQYRVGLTYSTFPLYQAKKFALPLTAKLYYRDRFAGENVLKSRYIGLDVSVFFSFF